MTNDALMTFAVARGHEIVFAPLTDNQAFSVENRRCHIFIKSGLSPNEEKELFAHELGHCEYGGFYNRYSPYEVKAKAEYRADKWAYGKIAPVRAVRRAIKKGVQTPWELAEVFEVSCEYMGRVLEHYRAVGLI